MPTYQPKIKIKKFKGKCEYCKKIINDKQAFSYVDGNNHSITQNSPTLCKECYIKKYGGK